MQNIVQQNRWSILLVLGLVLLAVWGSPYRFADGNNGRYLPNLYRAMDAELFSADPVADAFARFESLFYSGLGMAFGMVHLSPVQVEPVFYGLYILSKLALMILLWFLLRALNQDWDAFLILGAWAVHQKSAAVGGDSIFAPSLTHATLAVLLGILAITFLLHQKPIGFAIVLGSALFIHSLLALHLAMMVFPVLLIKESARFSKAKIIGVVLFGLFFLAYIILMTPPAFSAEETALFLSVKGSMTHISPLAQPLLGWVNMLGRLGLAWLAYWQFLREKKVFGLLAAFMLTGAFLAVSVGMAATISGSLQLAQLQPMRMFEWVNLFASILLACAVPRAMRQDRPIAALLLAVILLNILDSLWGLVWIFFGIAVLMARGLSQRWRCLTFVQAHSFLLSVAIFLTLSALAMWLFQDFHSFESFRDPIPVLVLVLCLPFMKLSTQKETWRWWLITTALLIAILGRSFYVYDYIAARQNADFNAICHWIALNTPKDARFITAVIDDGGGNFRARALRTSLNENQSALYWVAPLAGRENGEIFQQVQLAWNDQTWDMNRLLFLAQNWNADYILVEKKFFPMLPIVHRQGDYSVYKVSNDYP